MRVLRYALLPTLLLLPGDNTPRPVTNVRSLVTEEPTISLRDILTLILNRQGFLEIRMPPDELIINALVKRSGSSREEIREKKVLEYLKAQAQRFNSLSNKPALIASPKDQTNIAPLKLDESPNITEQHHLVKFGYPVTLSEKSDGIKVNLQSITLMKYIDPKDNRVYDGIYLEFTKDNQRGATVIPANLPIVFEIEGQLYFIDAAGKFKNQAPFDRNIF